MPNYDLPPLPEANDEKDEPQALDSSMDESIFPDRFDRMMRIPVNQAILDALRTDDMAEVMLTGRVVETTDHQRSEGANARFIEVEVNNVNAYRQGDRIEEEAMESAYNDEER